MKICAIGDLHGNLDKIKKIPLEGVDTILLTGDLGKADLARARFFENLKRKEKGLPEKEVSNEYREKEFMETYESAIETVKYLSKFAPVYLIFGNADNSNYKIRKKSKKIGKKLPFLADDLRAMNNVNLINNRIVNFKGVRIGGLENFLDTNWIEEFKPIDYEEKLKEAKKDTEKAKKVLRWFNSLDVLLCHQPPYGILDKINYPDSPHHGLHAGSKVILDYIKKYNPKYVFCGHIHKGEGMKKIERTEVYNLGEAGHKIIELQLKRKN